MKIVPNGGVKGARTNWDTKTSFKFVEKYQIN